MIRASLYVVAAGVIWVVEGYLFSRLLQMALWQTGLLMCVYLGLFVAAVAALWRAGHRRSLPRQEAPVWRYLALAPMLVAIVGSFVSLPLVLLVALLGRWLA